MPPTITSNLKNSSPDETESAASFLRWLVPATFAVLTFLMCIFPMRDTDFYWHLKTGELIWQRLQIPASDLYTYTDFDKPWIDLHWGFQLIVAAVYHLSGVNGIILLKASCYTLAVMIGWFATGNGLSHWIKALIWLPAVITISGRAYERPEMISLPCLAALLWILERIPHKPKLIWALPLLLIFWTNCHALFVLGMVVTGAFVAGGMLRNISPVPLRKKIADASLSTKFLILAAGLALTAPLMNPYLEKGWFFPLVLYRKFSVEHDFYSPRVGEFQQPIAYLQNLWEKSRTRGSPLGLSTLVSGQGLIYPVAEFTLWLIAAGAILWLLIRHRRVSIYYTLLLIGFSHLAWVATRNSSIFSLIAAAIACGTLSHTRQPDNQRNPRADSGHINQIAAILLTLMMGLVVSGEWGRMAETWKIFGWNEAPHWFGHDAMKFAGQPRMPQRAFVSHFGLAGTYIYHNGPDRKVFMDPRLEVCSRQTFELFERAEKLIVQGDPAWEAIVNPDGQEPPAIILDSRTARPLINALMFNPNWRLVFADPSAAVFMHSHLANQLHLPVADPRPLHHPPK